MCRRHVGNFQLKFDSKKTLAFTAAVTIATVLPSGTLGHQNIKLFRAFEEKIPQHFHVLAVFASSLLYTFFNLTDQHFCEMHQ